jgi:hypothetical protein
VSLCTHAGQSVAALSVINSVASASAILFGKRWSKIFVDSKLAGSSKTNLAVCSLHSVERKNKSKWLEFS